MPAKNTYVGPTQHWPGRFFSFFFGWANLLLVSDIFLGIFSSKKVHLIRIFLLKASLRWMNQSKLPSKYQKGQVVMMLLRITRWVVKFSDSKPREYVVLSQCHALHCVKWMKNQSWLICFRLCYLFYKEIWNHIGIPLGIPTKATAGFFFGPKISRFPIFVASRSKGASRTVVSSDPAQLILKNLSLFAIVLKYCISA